MKRLADCSDEISQPIIIAALRNQALSHACSTHSFLPSSSNPALIRQQQAAMMPLLLADGQDMMVASVASLVAAHTSLALSSVG